MNRKGYLMVEVVVATVLAVGISFFLVSIVMNIMTKTDDITKELKYMTVNASISKVLEEDLSSLQLSSLTVNTSTKEVFFNYNICPSNKEEYICTEKNKKLSLVNENNKMYLKYGLIKEDQSYDLSDNEYYVREIPKELTPGDLVFENNQNLYPDANVYDSLLIMTLPLKNIFENKNYDIKIAIPYSQTKLTLDLPSLSY